MPLSTSHMRESSAVLAVAGFSLLPSLGIACFRLSAWTLYTSDIGAQDQNMLFVSRMMQMCSIVLFLIIDRRVSYNRETLLKTMSVAAFFAMVGASAHLFATNETYSYIGVGVNGAAAGILMLGWGFYLCSVKPRESAFSITLAFALHGIMTWILPFVSQQLITTVTILFPLLSVLCLVKSIREIDPQPDAELSLRLKDISTVPRSIFALMFMCTIASIFAKFFAPLGSVLRTSPFYLFWPVIPLIIFLIYFGWMVFLKRDDQEVLWPIFVLVIFSGLFCYAIFSTTQPEFAAGFFRATSECLMLFCWIVSAPIVYRNDFPRIFSFGLALLVFVIPPTIISSLLSMVLPPVEATGSGYTAIIVTAALAFILVVATSATLVANALSVAKAGKDSASQTEPSLMEQAIESLAGEYGLTKREREVAQCLAKGYTFPQAAETLFISLDTVRTHVKNLYRKMGINKKQQLIAILEEHQRLSSLKESGCGKSNRT